MNKVKKENGITYDSSLFHLKREGRLVSILPVCERCGEKLDYDDIGEQLTAHEVVPDGEGGYVRMLGFVEFCKHCGYRVGDYGDVDEASEEEYREFYGDENEQS